MELGSGIESVDLAYSCKSILSRAFSHQLAIIISYLAYWSASLLVPLCWDSVSSPIDTCGFYYYNILFLASFYSSFPLDAAIVELLSLASIAIPRMLFL